MIKGAKELRELFDALQRAEPAVIAATRSAGVVRVEWTVGFVSPYDVWAWLGTSTDAQRDELPAEPFRDAVFQILVAMGLPVSEVGRFGTTKQSPETVDRDFQGSWFYAMR